MYRLRLVSALSYVQIQFVNKRWERSRLEFLHGWFWKFDPLLDKFNRNVLIFWCKNNFFPIVENLLYAHSKILLWTRHQGNDFVSFSINTLVTMVLIQPTEGNLQQPSRTSVHLNRSYIMHCSVSCSNWDFRSIQLLTIKWYH